MITKYQNFINESKIELLLEANLHIEPEFVEILSDIKSPLAKEILNLNNTEVNVNTNYISYDVNKDDRVLFRPDDKVEKSEYIFRGGSYTDTVLADFLTGYGVKIDLGIDGDPSSAPLGQIVKLTEIDKDELIKQVDKTKHWNKDNVLYAIKNNDIVIISWKNSYATTNKSFYIIVVKSSLEKDLNSVKQSEIAVGRFARALLKKVDVKFTDKQIEEFVNEYKTIMRIKRDAFKNFDIVKGDDIKYWYLESRYEKNNGTLGSSCMRYSTCQRYLNIYSENPDQVNLVIMYSTESKDKICGRALLWTDIKDRKFMDRIYVNDSSNEKLFIEFAVSKGFYYKKDQNYIDGEPLMYNRVELPLSDSIVEVKLDSDDFDKYPYMDTLKYYTIWDNSLSSNSDSNYDYCLNDTDGGNGSCDECGGSGEVNCEECSGEGSYECGLCEGEGTEVCEECDGEGEYECHECDGTGEVTDSDDETMECSNCNGRGREKCINCDGEGNVECSRCEGHGAVDCDDCYNGVVSCPQCS